MVIIGHAGHAQKGATNVVKVKQSSRRGARSQMDNGQKGQGYRTLGYTSALPGHKSMEDGQEQKEMGAAEKIHPENGEFVAGGQMWACELN